MAKKLQACQFSLKVFFPFFDILKTVLVIDLPFYFWVYSLKNVEFMANIVRIFLLKLALN